jgi:hypothetical protein
MRTILFGLIVALLNFSASECSAQQSKLPKEMPANTEISFHKNAGMIFAFTNIVITNRTISVEEKNGGEKQARKWSAKIDLQEQENLYKILVENSFDTIKNEERKGIVYDAGSEGISLNLGASAFYSVSYGLNSPLSAANQKRYQTVAKAINALRSKYEGKAQKTADSNFAVLDLSRENFNILFKNANPATLSDQELKSVKDILKKAVDEYNSKQKEDFRITDLDEYKFQLVALLNAKGEKEVWVNGFCSDFDKDWRTEIIGVEDGGRCYFNLYVNLTKQTFDRFSVNGES